jgi:hypothetical protein
VVECAANIKFRKCRIHPTQTAILNIWSKEKKKCSCKARLSKRAFFIWRELMSLEMRAKKKLSIGNVDKKSVTA